MAAQTIAALIGPVILLALAYLLRQTRVHHRLLIEIAGWTIAFAVGGAAKLTYDATRTDGSHTADVAFGIYLTAWTLGGLLIWVIPGHT